MNTMNGLRSELTGLYSELDLGNLLDTIAEKIKAYLQCGEASIFLYHREKEELIFEIATGESTEELKKITIKKGEGVAGWIAEHRETLILNDCSSDPRFAGTADERTHFKTRSILGCPVISGSSLIGVVEAINKNSGEFSGHDRDLLKEFAAFISIPLQNAILFRDVMNESREKGQLIELVKMVSSSFSFEDVFDSLKNIIMEIIPATGINIMVDSQKKVYRLIEEERTETDESQDRTIIRSNQAIFPLRTTDKHLGFLEVRSERPIHDKVISLLRGLSIFAAIAINKYEMYCDLLEKEKIEKELQIARDIQQSFLLNRRVEIKGLECSFVNLPSSSVGGDYYDIITLNDERTVFTINDISGHGIPASLLMSIVRANFIYSIRKEKDILLTTRYLNDLIAETTDCSLYVTAFTCLIDTGEKMLRFINCGHVPTVLIRDGNTVELTEGDTVLGMFGGTEFRLHEYTLKKDDMILLYTDGVAEAENGSGEEFSLDRIKKTLIGMKDRDTERMKDELISELKHFTGTDTFIDDITFILIRIL